ncbi:PepSY domain-containing protein [Tabrizicola sp. M-4]|uniref:PepSY domain-containing protein n=1 Tax=Tabrizicola sp. M-4 TaxID=3055847 RepID=UPI003DA98037
MSTSLLLACLVLAVPARAEEDCNVPMSEWQPRDAVAALAERNGWRVARIRLDDGCYEVIGEDAQGRRIEVKLDPASLTILAMEFEDHDDHDAGEDGDDD